MNEPFLAELQAWRRQTLTQTLEILERKQPIFPVWDQRRNRYGYETAAGVSVSLPVDSGVYVFHSAKTDTPVYVGEAVSLKRRLGRHCRVSGSSVFRRRWVPHWMGTQVEKEDVLGFIHSRMYFKYVVLPFGRLEIEADLRALWGLHGPESVNSNEF
jgi:hypothetical protein